MGFEHWINIGAIIFILWGAFWLKALEIKAPCGCLKGGYWVGCTPGSEKGSSRCNKLEKDWQDVKRIAGDIQERARKLIPNLGQAQCMDAPESIAKDLKSLGRTNFNSSPMSKISSLVCKLMSNGGCPIVSDPWGDKCYVAKCSGYVSTSDGWAGTYRTGPSACMGCKLRTCIEPDLPQICVAKRLINPTDDCCGLWTPGDCSVWTAAGFGQEVPKGPAQANPVGQPVGSVGGN